MSQSPIKIFFLADGSSSHTEKWVLGLLEANIEIYLFSLRDISDKLKKHPRLKSYSCELLVSSNASAFNKSTYLKVIPKLRKEIKLFAPDILHAHYASSYGLLALLSGFRPYFVSLWGSDIMVFPKRSALHRFIFSRILKNAKQVLATSVLMQNLAKNYLKNDSCIQIPFGVDISNFTPFEKPETNSFVFGIVKTMAHNYGIDIAIEAFKLLIKKYPNKQLLLRIAGDGILRQEYETLAAEYLNTKIEFIGKIKHQEVPSFLQKLDVFINISRSESFGVSVLEASACGIPVIISDKGGLPETVIADKSGLILNNLNSQDCFEAMEEYLLHPEKAKKHGENGRHFIVNRYDFNKNIEEQIEVYNTVLEA